MSCSAYSDVDKADRPEHYVDRLDRVAATDFWRATKHLTYMLLELRPGASLLDVGCGTGDDTRVLAGVVGASGRAVGVDLSQAMIAMARSRSETLAVPAEFYQCDAHHLQFPDASFDGCRAERVLQHVEDPRRVLAEMVRVARTGARLVVAEPDYGTLAVEGADPLVTRRILECRREHFLSGRIGSELPRMFLEAGLRDIRVHVRTLAGTGNAMGDSQLRKYVALAENAKVITATVGRRWLADLVAADRRGAYRHAIAVFIVRGLKS